MITAYRPVTWNAGEPLSVDKLSTMTSNDQYLFEALPTLVYNNNNIKKNTGVKILATSAIIAPTTSRHGRATVYFGDTFAIGCRPVISLSINASPQEQYHLAMKGIGTLVPDHRGVEILASAAELSVKDNKIPNNIYMHVIAIGF